MPTLPQKWPKEMLRGIETESLPDFPDEMIVSGTGANRGKTLFSGQTIAMIWEGGPAKYDIAEPYPYDQFILILEGILILHDTEGVTETYVPGDSLVLPKGFVGTWEMPGPYRELIVVETNAYSQAE